MYLNTQWSHFQSAIWCVCVTPFLFFPTVPSDERSSGGIFALIHSNASNCRTQGGQKQRAGGAGSSFSHNLAAATSEWTHTHTFSLKAEEGYCSSSRERKKRRRVNAVHISCTECCWSEHEWGLCQIPPQGGAVYQFVLHSFSVFTKKICFFPLINHKIKVCFNKICVEITKKC